MALQQGRHLTAATSTPIRRYVDGEISAKEYFREVERSTTQEVERELAREPERVSTDEKPDE